jgi:hypothetical protein
MKEMISQKIAQLGSAQECMLGVADRIEQWEQSQLTLEKSAFTAINISDKILNLSMKGTSLIDKLYKELDAMLGDIDRPEMNAPMLKELQQLFDHILSQAKDASDIAHQFELEVALQREIVEEMKNNLSTVAESLDDAVACAEFILADMQLTEQVE